MAGRACGSALLAGDDHTRAWEFEPFQTTVRIEGERPADLAGELYASAATRGFATGGKGGAPFGQLSPFAGSGKYRIVLNVDGVEISRIVTIELS